MRLIDADVLRDYLQRLASIEWNQGVVTSWSNAYEECADMVDDMPTIEPQKWIPVSERLPKQQQTVLIQDFGQITIGYLNAENRWRNLTNLDDYLKGVEAWMPLPEPWKGEEG